MKRVKAKLARAEYERMTKTTALDDTPSSFSLTNEINSFKHGTREE